MDEALIIPADLASCQTLIGELARTIGDVQSQLQRVARERDELQLAFNELLQKAFRQRSERYLEDPQQLQLDFDNTDEAADAALGLAEAIAQAGIKPAEIVVPEHTRRRRVPKVRNEQLPAHLPRYEVTAVVSEAVSICPEHGPRQVIGQDRVETLEFERPKLRVRVTLYPKYACEHEAACGVAQPPRPNGLVEGNRYDTSVAAEIITAKYGYHLPIYRQQDWFAGSGWLPGRSTLLNILGAAATF
jgi:transposase